MSIAYVGDGSSDVHVMMHVNLFDGLTIEEEPAEAARGAGENKII